MAVHKKAVVWGTTTPMTSGLTVTVQKKSPSGAWKAVCSTKTKKQKLPNGKTSVGFSCGYNPTGKGTFSLRAHAAGTATDAAANSAVLHLKVH